MTENASSELPADLLDDLELAADVTERLADSGRRLHYEVDAETGRLTVELQDGEGNLVRRVGPTEATEIALGARPEPADR